jgi:hypothetical protein
MKERLIKTFINWILTSRNYVEYPEDCPEEFLKGSPDDNYYPNALTGLEFILNHCSCVSTIREPDKNPELLGINFFETEYFGSVQRGDFEITKMIMRTMPHPHGEGYEPMTLVMGNFEHILKDLIIYTLKRIPDYEIEQFLMEQL